MRTQICEEPDGRYGLWVINDDAGTRRFSGSYERRAHAAQAAEGLWREAKAMIARYERHGVYYVAGRPVLAGWD